MLTWGWMKMLKVENLVISYGGIEALKGISLEVPKGRLLRLSVPTVQAKARCCAALSAL